MAFFTVDPGLAKVGWARWDDGQCRLADCGLSKSSSKDFRTRIADHLSNIGIVSSDRVVCERMQARYGNAKGDVQDLIDLNLLAGALGNEWITVREWKGSMPRKIKQNRTCKTLTVAERALLPNLKTPNSVGHDVWSAVGIGLYVLGRYK